MPTDPVEAKQIAAQLISDVWREAAEKGIASDLFASTALSAALASLVKMHGREAAAAMTDRFAAAIRSGNFDS